ncbi:TPA: LysR substrate-binding domain-containing protein [Photobacterium damselae]
MKLKQLKYLKSVVDNGLNISLAAQELYTSQPGISKQIKLLESELGVQIFERKGKNLSVITKVGKDIIAESNRILDIEEKIRSIVKVHNDPEHGYMNIYTTNTISRFLLPETISYLVGKYPKIPFHVGVAHPSENGIIIKRGPSDFSIIAHEIEHNVDLITLPAYKWSLSIIVPIGHPLLNGDLTLDKISQYSLISYEEGSSGRLVLDNAFSKIGVNPNYFMTVMDVDVIKKYVSMELGVGIIATIAAKNICDNDIVYIPLDGLIDNCNAWLCFGKNVHLQDYMYDFIEFFSPHLTKPIIERVMSLSHKEIEDLSKTLSIPIY